MNLENYDCQQISSTDFFRMKNNHIFGNSRYLAQVHILCVMVKHFWVVV